MKLNIGRDTASSCFGGNGPCFGKKVGKWRATTSKWRAYVGLYHALVSSAKLATRCPFDVGPVISRVIVVGFAVHDVSTWRWHVRVQSMGPRTRGCPKRKAKNQLEHDPVLAVFSCLQPEGMLQRSAHQLRIPQHSAHLSKVSIILLSKKRQVLMQCELTHFL